MDSSQSGECCFETDHGKIVLLLRVARLRNLTLAALLLQRSVELVNSAALLIQRNLVLLSDHASEEVGILVTTDVATTKHFDLSHKGRVQREHHFVADSTLALANHRAQADIAGMVVSLEIQGHTIEMDLTGLVVVDGLATLDRILEVDAERVTWAKIVWELFLWRFVFVEEIQVDLLFADLAAVVPSVRRDLVPSWLPIADGG